jgi:hypothetical protein
LQQLRRSGIHFDFLAQAMHQLLQELPVSRVAVTPDLDQEAVGADGMAGIGQQHLQQSQFELREPHRIGGSDLDGVLLDIQGNTAGR